jgi:hypothetical protein
MLVWVGPPEPGGPDGSTDVVPYFTFQRKDSSADNWDYELTVPLFSADADIDKVGVYPFLIKY